MKSVRKITSNSGITLITLVITIIIILILAGVSIAMILGNNGIISQGKNSKMKNEIGEYIEKIELARGETTVDRLGGITLGELIDKVEYKNDLEQWGIVAIEQVSSEEAEAVTKEGYVIIIAEKGCWYDRLETDERIPALKEGDLVISQPSWNASTYKASVTITKGNNISNTLEVQYKKNGDPEQADWDKTGWEIGNNVTDLNHGDVVYARLWNGSTGGAYTSLTVKDSIEPTITIDYYNSGTSWINVDVSTRDNQWGMPASPIYTWYIKKAAESDSAYVKQDNTGAYCYFNGLAQSTSYTVKVEVKDKAQNTGTAILQQTTGTVPTTYDHISIGDVTWNSSTHKANVNINVFDVTCDTMPQYQVNGTDENGWLSVGWTSKIVTDLNHGDIVYARLWDGINGGSYTSLTVKDSTAPNINVSITSIGSNWLTASVSASDSEWGMETSPTYTWYIKKASQGDSSYVKQSSTGTTCSFYGLDQKTSYTVKAEVKDKAQNTGSGTDSGTTGNVQIAEGNISIGNPTWSSNKASVKITKGSSAEASLKIQYQVNGTADNGWLPAGGSSAEVTVPNLNHGDVVNARLWDGNNGGSYTSLTVKDSKAPTVRVTIESVGTNLMSASVSASDSEWGMPASPTYTWYIKKTAEADTKYVKQSSTGTTCSFYGLDQKTSYTVKAEVKDKAQNTGSGTDSGTTGTVIIAEGNIKINAPTWSANKASVYIEKQGSDSRTYMVQYQVNGTVDNGWTTGANVGNLNHGDMVYARLWDGNNGGSYTSLKITDANAPTVNVSITSVGTNSISAKVSASDSEWGMETSPTYTWYIKKTAQADTAYVKQSSTGTTCNFTGLDPNTAYTIKVEVKDKAKNLGTGTKSGTTSSLPLATSALKVGDYVKYTPTAKSYTVATTASGTSQSQTFNSSDYTGTWRVLYNDSTNGLQLISNTTVTDNLKLSGKVGYNNIVLTLNTISGNYINTEYADSARSVGNQPSAIATTAGATTLYTNSSYSFISNYANDLKIADTNYSSDVNVLENKGLLNIGKDYWMASRYISISGNGAGFCGAMVGTFNNYSGLGSVMLNCAHSNLTGNNHEYTAGVRPVVKLKSTIKAKSGSGTSSSPWELSL